MQCAAAIRAVRAGQLDRIGVPQNPLDILAQQIVATIASQKMGEEELWQLVHRAYPFRNLARDDFEAVLEMVCEGMASSRGRRSAHLHRDRVHRRLRPRRGARLAAITGGGAIPDTADYDVIEEPAETYVGKVNEDFAVESMAADIFLLGNRSWRIRRVEAGKIRVADAEGAPPSIPFWLGEAPARTQELSGSVAALREQVAARLDGLHSEQPAPYAAGRDDSAVNWLMADCGVDRAGAEQIIAYVADTRAVLGAVPTQTTIIAERFFDESGGMQLVIHAPFGARINRAWGLALRKRFCRTFDFELQAAATDDGIVLSLGEQHSFPLEGVFTMLRPATVENDLLQAALATPMFSTRWRWNATRALALLRRTGGRRVPMPIQRMRAEDLLAAVFPAQLACGDNHPRGAMEPPDHPLVNETIDNCLHEAMDTDGLRGLIESIEGGAIRTIAVDTPAPSPMSHEILNANPYAFLDDAPLEERRARAVSLRRVEPDLTGGIGALDPAAIRAVRAQAWPDVRDADELHDLLLSLVVLPLPASGGDANHLLTDPPLPDGVLVGEETRQKCLGAPWDSMAIELVRERRATRARWGAYEALVAAERMGVVQAALPDVRFDPPPPALPDRSPVEAETAQRAIVRGWMECVGPVTAGALAAFLGVLETKVEAALLRLESEGIVLRGRFTNTTDSREPIAHDKGPSQFHYQLSPIDHEPSLEWCDRRLLARIHRLTIAGLRREIEAVSAAEFIRFLVRWQHVHPGTQLHGRTGVVQVIKQLQGIELPASAWERKVLPARISLYDTADLDRLCLAGEVAWGRLRLPDAGGGDEEGLSPAPTRRRASPTRVAPLALVMREALPALLEAADVDVTADISPAAREVLAHLQQHGASFLVDIARATGRLITETEEALWELVARGVVTGDGIAGLRTLLLPDVKRRRPRRRLHALHGGLAPRLLPAGRWALLRTVSPVSAASNSANEFFAAQLLRRYGVVFRELLVREVRAPAWRVLRDIYRRMEARGAIRGGRFVAGFVGEQFALPDAVDALRAVRRTSPDVKPVVIAAADPLNLVGILTPGHRVSPFSNQAIAYENGVPIEVGALGAVMSRLRGRTSVATTVSLSKRLSR
ncbi:MAG: DEAD/DEAH box helicase [Candidatus Binatia bacterium]